MVSCEKDCYADTDIQTPVCGDGECGVYGGVDEFYTCGTDCGVKCTKEVCWADYCGGSCIRTNPVCGNGKCEVSGGVDEFYTCGTDCGIICGDNICTVFPVNESKTCAKDCVFGLTPPITIPPITINGVTQYNTNYKVKVYYVYNAGTKDSVIVNNIKPVFNSLSTMFKNYNGITLTTNVEEVLINFPIANKDYYHPFNERELIWKELDNKINLKSDVENFDSLWLVMGGTPPGGCFSVDYKTPIYCDGVHFSPSNDNVVILTAHEFLHNFGCKDINEGKKGDIMGDLSITTISTSTLGECGKLFKPQNYGKQTYNEYVGFNIQSIFSQDLLKVYRN